MTDRASAEGLREAIDAALHELGEPGPGYPAPVANAVDMLAKALAAAEDAVAIEYARLATPDLPAGWLHGPTGDDGKPVVLGREVSRNDPRK